MKAHKDNTKNFEELTYAEQANSINAYILDLKNMIIAHKKRAEQEGKEDSSHKFLTNMEKVISELKQ